jgi:protein-tyrosine phosphatase
MEWGLCYNSRMKTNAGNPTEYPYSRKITIDFVGNLRDLGGYRSSGGRPIAWRRLFRSAELRHRNEEDVALFRQVTGVKAVLDLRGDLEIKQPSVDLLTGGGIHYLNIPLIAGGRGPGSDGEDELFKRFKNMGEFYLMMLRHPDFGRKLVAALEFIAEPANQPVLFHCTVGKDRTGILAASVLGVLGIPEPDIIADYNLTTPFMAGFKERMKETDQGARMVEDLPAYFWEASPESMSLVLSEIRREFGSLRSYLENHGAGAGLFEMLENSLLDEGA